MSDAASRKVLVMSAGSVPGFAVIQALRQYRGEERLAVLAADMNPVSVGFQVADESFVVPSASGADFIPKILDICRARKVECVFPVIDEELAVFAENIDVFRKFGISVISNSPETVRLTKDKYEFFKRCRKLGVLAPDTCLPGEFPPGEARFPLLVKPRDGRGSANVFRVRNRQELEFFSSYVSGGIIQEFIEGTEYTVDLLTDLNGNLICALPKQRLEVKAGMQVKGRTVNHPKLVGYARRLCQLFDLAPRVNFQCIVRGEEIFLIEINPKFPASLPLTVAAGLNTPLLLLQLYRGEKVPDPSDKLIFDLSMIRTWQEFFVNGTPHE
ncbi:MAG: ATP-grasp domain-containing protein [Acidobacteria bacterium]|nr:ATP-grasp domain-containing protein [Acidobacteriota bacterium]